MPTAPKFGFISDETYAETQQIAVQWCEEDRWTFFLWRITGEMC